MDARWRLLTAIAPIAWGSTYFVTHEFLPADAPVWGSIYRAIPAGLLLLIISRRLPRGRWWWRALVLGVLNVAGFFLLVYTAATLLPASLAATLMAASPIAIMLAGWLLLAQRPRTVMVVGAVVGALGVILLVAASGELDIRGIAASLGGLVCSSAGYALATRWAGNVNAVSSVAWQLVLGGLVLVPIAAVFEGAPRLPSDVAQVFAYGYVTLVATALANLVWLVGFRRLPAGTVGRIGLLNPATGVLLGTLLGGETFTIAQFFGLALVVIAIVLGTLRYSSKEP